MNDTMLKRLSNLLSVKSLVTLTRTGEISKDFMTIYAVIIAFYFGTQSSRSQGADQGEGGSNAQ